MLVMASLTSVSLDLVKSEPWEATVQAAVGGLGVNISHTGGQVEIRFLR